MKIEDNKNIYDNIKPSEVKNTNQENPNNQKNEDPLVTVKSNKNNDKKLMSRREALFAIGKGTAIASVVAGTKLEAENPGTLKKAFKSIGNVVNNILERKTAEGPESSEVVSEKQNAQIEQKETIDEHFKLAYKILKRNKEIFPPKLFTEAFLAAVRIQESKGIIKNRPKKEGHPETLDDAFGLYQNRRPAIRDVPRFLLSLHKKKTIDYNGPLYIDPAESKKNIAKLREKYGEREFKKEQIESITEQLQEDESLSFAMGELYFMQLFNQYGIGKDEFEAGNYNKARVKLLAAYHDGPTEIYKTGKVPKNTEVTNYINKVSELKRQMPKAQSIMKKFGINEENYNIASIICREMSYNPKWTIEKLVNKIKKTQKSPETDLSYIELEKVYNDFQNEMQLLALRNDIKKHYK